MDLSQYAANASASPPDPPSSPSAGYPTNGNPSGGVPATRDGAYWSYQIQAEIAALLGDANITPSHTALTQMRDALRALGLVRPVEALPYPTICNASNKLTVTPASASAGGTVSIAAGTWVELCEEIAAGETGRIRSAQTPAYTSEDLDVTSTYYIRARMGGGVLSLYKQKGTDSDAGWSQSWTGTPDGASGGGVDTSKVDMLIARVATGSAGTVPTVTALANAAVLRVDEFGTCVYSASSVAVALNLARRVEPLLACGGFTPYPSGGANTLRGSFHGIPFRYDLAAGFATQAVAVWAENVSRYGATVFAAQWEDPGSALTDNTVYWHLSIRG